MVKPQYGFCRIENIQHYDEVGCRTIFVGVKEQKGIPTVFALEQNYPNPFNPTTNLSFVLGEPSLVTLKVFNVIGQEIRTLLDNEVMDEGGTTN